MALTVDRTRTMAADAPIHRRRARPALWVVAMVAAGGSLAVLVGRDGSPGWQVVRVVGVAGATVAAVAAHRRMKAWRPLSVGIGIVAMAVGAGFAPYVAKEGVSVEAVAGMGALGAGLTLAVAGVVAGTRGRRPLRRLGAGAATLVAAVIVTFVIGPAVAATNVPRPGVGATPESRGLAYQPVTVTTSDGVDLAGWYVPSANRAAVVLLHGAGSTRSNVLDEAAVLARNGFGVLMIDARGHGASGGRAMDFGWHGNADIAAATMFLAGRPDVDGTRIGVVGLSMGGEEALGASGSNDRIRAVVAEGATARSADDEAWLSDEFGVRGLIQEQLERLQDWVTDALTSASVPTSSRAAVEGSGDTRYLLITAGNEPDEARSAAHVSAGAPHRVEIWTVEGAGHTAGLETSPQEWQTRVVAFLDDALRVGAEVGR